MTPAARPDHRLIAELVAPGSRLLDIGCGDGTLLELLSIYGYSISIFIPIMVHY